MITLVADTTSSITVPVAKQMGMPYPPQIIVFGDGTLRDDFEIDSNTRIKRMREMPNLPKNRAAAAGAL